MRPSRWNWRPALPSLSQSARKFRRVGVLMVAFYWTSATSAGREFSNDFLKSGNWRWNLPAWTRSKHRSPSVPARITRWEGSPRINGARLNFPACTLRANVPASACTAPIGWEEIPCSKQSFLDAGQVAEPPSMSNRSLPILCPTSTSNQNRNASDASSLMMDWNGHGICETNWGRP